MGGAQTNDPVGPGGICTLAHAGWFAYGAVIQVPVLEVDGQMIAQSRTILNYVGRATKLYPGDPYLGAKCEEFCDTIDDCVTAAMSTSFGKTVQRFE